MKIVEYLEKNQQIPYKIFKNALVKDALFHAYLLNGSIGTPLLEIAKFIAKSILCPNHNPFCCDECSTCKRIDNNVYNDLIIVDGLESTIKKEDISNIITTFSNTASETKGIKIYILNMVENMTVDATNSLLKFLEEPPKNTFAILTTENKFKILPTILSRTEIINFSLLNQDDLISESISLNVLEEDAELLSFFYNDALKIKEESSTSDYEICKNNVLRLLENISNQKDLIYILETSIIPSLKTKEQARLFFDYLIVFFKESLKYSINKQTLLKSYVKIINGIVDHINKIDKAILHLTSARNELNYNLLTNLLILNTFYKIFED